MRATHIGQYRTELVRCCLKKGAGFMDKDYENKLNAEIEKRIEEMESADYEFPQRFNRTDWFVLAVVCAVSLAVIIMGAWL